MTASDENPQHTGVASFPNEEIVEAISLQCNTVEIVDSFMPTGVSIPLKGSFFVISKGIEESLPPDPGAAGKSSKPGIDSDGDCVRDDIERFIAKRLPHSNKKKARKYLYEYAKWRGQFLISQQSGFTKSIGKEISRNLYRSAECFRRVLNDDTQSAEILDMVFSKFHNTFPRSYAYLDNNKLIGGWTTRETIPISCP
jgi:hypothetical protein